MKGKIKFVCRLIKVDDGSNYNDTDKNQGIIKTYTFAVLYNKKRVGIDEQEIRNRYGGNIITNSTISRLNKKLRNKEIEFQKIEDYYSLKEPLTVYL